MSGDFNKVKAAQLGMPIGTAAGRLRKKILFSLLQRLDEDVCFKCGEEIESTDELSIEHKKPWLHTDDPVGLFFDIDNIAFSHLSCNKANRTGNRHRRADPPRLFWGSGCQKHLPRETFGSWRDELGRPRAYCKACRKARGWEHGNR
jgi:hypothetical protein